MITALLIKGDVNADHVNADHVNISQLLNLKPKRGQKPTPLNKNLFKDGTHEHGHLHRSPAKHWIYHQEQNEIVIPFGLHNLRNMYAGHYKHGAIPTATIDIE